MFGKETQDEKMDLHIEDHLLVTEDKISIGGARLHVVLYHIHRQCKSQEGPYHAVRWVKTWLRRKE